jgi:pSer/pThr/pTyr-binding forkhead associated (FHA) protein
VIVPPAIIGRADANAGTIDVDLGAFAEGAYVSRRHAKIVAEGGGFVLEDLGSSNGTYIKRDDYERVERVGLEDGDEIAFGNAKFVFRLEA